MRQSCHSCAFRSDQKKPGLSAGFFIARKEGLKSPGRGGANMDPTDLGPGTATWLGGTGTVLLGGFLWLRKFLSKDAADRAMDNADIGTVRRQIGRAHV